MAYSRNSPESRVTALSEPVRSPRRDWELAHGVALDWTGWCRAVAVVGSLVTQPHRREANSDIDFIVLVDDLLRILSSVPGLDVGQACVARTLLREGRIDAISTKVRRDGANLSMSVYAAPRFNTLLTRNTAAIAYYRTRSNAGRVVVRSLQGLRREVLLVPTAVGDGYVVQEPCWPTDHEGRFCGILPDALLSGVCVMHDDGSLRRALDALWDSVAATAARDMGWRAPSADAIAEIVSRYFVHAETLHTDSRRVIRTKCAEALARLGVT